MKTQTLFICNWGRGHVEDRYMNTVDRSKPYIESHGICAECKSVVSAELERRKEAAK